MIDSQEALDALCDALEGQAVLAIDCEMDSMYAYGTSLCLVQVGWSGNEALIDGLAGLDRARLGVLFADPGRVKVFHGGENDIGLMRSRWGFDFRNTFDTMAASQVLGHDGVGLAAALDRWFDVKLSKKFQKADWRVRPLPDDQAEYARLDVRYLIPLRERLLAELQGRLARVEEAESEFLRISRAHIDEKPFDADNWIKVKGCRELPNRLRGAVAALYVARDEISRRLDRAPFRVLHDSALIELVRHPPGDEQAYRGVRGINRHLPAREVGVLLGALREGLERGEIPLPQRKGRRRPWDEQPAGGLSPEQEKVFDALRSWRGARAKSRGVDIARVATTNLLMSIARVRPTSREQLGAVDGIEPWRLREYADEILDVVKQAGA